GLDEIRIGVGYDIPESEVAAAHDGEFYETVTPKYETLPGWKGSTVGITKYEDLPEEAKAYIKRIEQLIDCPVDIISTGPDRDETIVLRDPYDA
ncbi:MAG TPA: adenylosuccinate synthetase, partial [Psychrobacter pasteurii]|nr:adenylosuccinate synthetase [Psychrobacter pasteurii]